MYGWEDNRNVSIVVEYYVETNFCYFGQSDFGLKTYFMNRLSDLVFQVVYRRLGHLVVTMFYSGHTNM